MKQRRTALLAALLVAVALLSGAFSATAFAATGTTLDVETVEAAPGSSVSVDVSISNNPGILGMALQVDYDDALTLTGGVSGDAFSALTMARPGKYVSGCRFTWDGLDLGPSDIKDGTVLTLAFDVAADATPGATLPIDITCSGPVDAGLNAVDVSVKNGAIKVSGESPVAAEAESLTVSKDVTEYNVGDVLATDDLHVLVNYTDKTVKTLSAGDYEVDSSAVSMTAPGVYPIKVSYAEGGVDLQGSVNVTVNGVLESIQASKTKTVYAAGDELDVDDITVMATYSGNQRKKVTNFTTDASGVDMSAEGEYPLVVSFADGNVTKTATITITVEKARLESIKAQKAKKTYTVGDALDTSDVVVKATYSDGRSVKVTDFTTNADAIDMNTLGEKTLTVTYVEDGVTATDDIAITVTEAGQVNDDLMFISVEYPENGEYYAMVGDTFDLSGLKVYGTYYSLDDPVLLTPDLYEIDDSDLYADPDDEYSFDIVDENKVFIESGFCSIKITSTENPEETAYVWVYVGETSYYIEADASDLVYEPGQEIDLADLNVKVHYEGKETAEAADPDDLYVTVRAANDEDDEYGTPLEDADLTKIGDYELIVTYQEGSSRPATAIVPISIRRDIVKAASGAKIVDASGLDAAYLFGLTRVPAVEVPGLVEGTDYRVEYRDNVNAGMAKALVIGIGDYAGVKELPFEIEQLALWLTFPEIGVAQATCTGKAIKPAVTFGLGDLTEGVDYTIAYANNVNVGQATVRLTGKGNFKGTETLTFKIVPGKVAISKPKAAKKKFTAKWKALPGGVKYQVQYRKGEGKWKTKTASKTKLKIKKLKSRKKYQVRVRAFKKVGGETYYGAWSATKTVKVK